MAATPGQKGEKRPRHVMWQDHLRPRSVFTVTSEEFAPYYLAEIRHDMRQTTIFPALEAKWAFVLAIFTTNWQVQKLKLDDQVFCS
jgi:hypothetical protein